MASLRLLTICASDESGGHPFMDAFRRALATANTPARTGYWLNKLFALCSNEAREFDAVRNKRVMELGVPIEDQPGQVRVPADKLPALLEELAALDRDVELPTPPAPKLTLPPSFTPADWQPIMAALDIFEEPS